MMREVCFTGALIVGLGVPAAEGLIQVLMAGVALMFAVAFAGTCRA